MYHNNGTDRRSAEVPRGASRREVFSFSTKSLSKPTARAPYRDMEALPVSISAAGVSILSYPSLILIAIISWAGYPWDPERNCSGVPSSHEPGPKIHIVFPFKLSVARGIFIKPRKQRVWAGRCRETKSSRGEAFQKKGAEYFHPSVSL